MDIVAVLAVPLTLTDAADDSGRATVIKVNTEYSGSIKSGDFDWYKFTATEHTYNVYIECTTENTSLNYTLYDSDFVVVKKDSYVSKSNSGILSLSKNRTYYLKIGQQSQHCPDYTFAVFEYQYPDKVAYYQYIKGVSEYSSFYGFNTENHDVFNNVVPSVSFDEKNAICIPGESYITYEMNKPIKNVDKAGDIVVRSTWNINYGYGYADVYVSSDTETWNLLGTLHNYSGYIAFDIGDLENIKYIRIVGRSNIPFNLLTLEICTGYSASTSISSLEHSQQGTCTLYSADVSPKKGYSNRTDNDMSGTSFTYTVETSSDVTDIYILTETNWKITSNYFNYITKEETGGNLKWTFGLNINSPGSRAFNIVGVDASGKETNSVCVNFEVVKKGSIYDDVSDDSSYINEVKYLKENSIITGKENNNFDPEGYLTRAEAATIICRMAGFNSLSGADTGFTDVPSSHWASGYVKKAKDMGIISGIGNNLFDPDGILTGFQFVKMAVCQLGYNDVVQNQYGNDSYPNGFYYYAKDKLNLLKNIQSGDYSASMKRSDASVLAYNAMHAEKYTYKEPENTTVANSGIISELLNLAQKLIDNTGNKYVYGGNPQSGVDPTVQATNFDCSSFTKYVYGMYGIKLERTSAGQAQQYSGSYSGSSSSGTRISKIEDLQPGDLIAFTNKSDGTVGHVAIYEGDGIILHAANPEAGLRRTKLKGDSRDGDYYSKYFGWGIRFSFEG